MPERPITEYRTPVIGQQPNPTGLTFPDDGTGLQFDAGYPLTFPPDPIRDPGSLFPTMIPEVEKIVYQTVLDACSSRMIFPTEGQGIPLPAAFSIPPSIGLFAGKDSTYTIPAGPNAGQPIPPIPVVRGWPAYPGVVPAIGVAESTSTEDSAERGTAGGFAGDVNAVDELGNIVATCAYYAEPLRITVVVELIHTNRDERDRLSEQLWRTLLPLRRSISDQSPQVRDVQLGSEKQDLPIDEQPIVMYVSVFTIEVDAEALVPTEIVTAAAGGVITQVITTITPTPPEN